MPTARPKFTLAQDNPQGSVVAFVSPEQPHFAVDGSGGYAVPSETNGDSNSPAPLPPPGPPPVPPVPGVVPINFTAYGIPAPTTLPQIFAIAANQTFGFTLNLGYGGGGYNGATYTLTVTFNAVVLFTQTYVWNNEPSLDNDNSGPIAIASPGGSGALAISVTASNILYVLTATTP